MEVGSKVVPFQALNPACSLYFYVLKSLRSQVNAVVGAQVVLFLSVEELMEMFQSPHDCK
jgi:hypothetical protein